MRLLKLMLFSILFLNIASAAALDLTPIIPVTAVTVVIFLALMNMLGSAIASPQIGAWVKSELRELIAGVILVVIIYSFFIGSTGVTAALTGKGDYLNASADIIDDILTDSTTGYDRAMHDIIRAGTLVRAAASYSTYISVPIWYLGLSYSTAPISGVGPLFGSLAGATQGLTNVIFLYEGILLLLKFAATAGPAVLLPLSLSLRLIPFSRNIGNTLIAISLAAIMLLPFSVLLVDQIHKVITYPKAYLTEEDLDGLDPNTWAMTFAEPFCETIPIRVILQMNDLVFGVVSCLPIVWSPAYWGCVQFMQNIVYQIINIVFAAIYVTVLNIWQAATGEGYTYAEDAFEVVYPFLTEVNNLVLLGYLDAIIIAVVTISGARSISVALGGEWYLGGIQRLI